MNNEALVIGNGPSRLNFDLHELNALMTTYGCNALYRDFLPDYLISMDYSLVSEIITHKVHHATKFYTQHDNRIDKLHEEGEPINFFWGQSKTIDSGNSALMLALQNGHDTVYIIGFDYSSSPSQMPNVYQGTKYYGREHVYHCADTKELQWINQLSSTLKKYPNQRVVRVVGTKNLSITKPNYSEVTIEQFKETINARIFV
jgi:hypothetical protein